MLVYVPILDQEYSVFIPVGKTIGTVKSIIMKAITELTEQEFTNDMNLLDKVSGEIYDNDSLVKNTKVRNGTKLMLI